MHRLKTTGKRKDIFFATKFGGAVGGGTFSEGRTVCGDPNYVAKAVDRSLQQLGTDYIDLRYLIRSFSSKHPTSTLADSDDIYVTALIQRFRLRLVPGHVGDVRQLLTCIWIIADSSSDG